MENMNPFDIIVLAILVLSVFMGGMRGVIAQIATIASWVISWFIAARYYTVAAKLLPISETYSTPVAIVITFLVCAIVIELSFRFLKKAISFAGLKEFDRQAGAAFGGLKGALLCLLITFFGVIISDKTRDFVNDSRSGPFFIAVIEHIQGHFPESKLKNKFRELAVQNKVENSKTESLETQIDSLKNYLKTSVLSSDAVEIVDETVSGDEVSTNSSLSSFLSNMKKIPNWIRSVSHEESNGGEGTSTGELPRATGYAAYENGAYVGNGERPSSSGAYSGPSYSSFGSYDVGSNDWRSEPDHYSYSYSFPDLAAEGSTIRPKIDAYLGDITYDNYLEPYATSWKTNDSATQGYLNGAGNDYSTSVADSFASDRNEVVVRTHADNASEMDSRTSNVKKRRRSSRSASSVRLGSYSYSSPSGTNY
jgi:membrane protein required for colicin V production